MKHKNELITVDRESLGEYLHAALRKCCDSDPAHLLHSVITLCDKAWADYLDLVWEELEGATKDDMHFRLRSAGEKLEYQNGYKAGELGALRRGLRSLSADDLRGMSSFLHYQHERSFCLEEA